jgi:hypothetical protein
MTNLQFEKNGGVVLAIVASLAPKQGRIGESEDQKR